MAEQEEELTQEQQEQFAKYFNQGYVMEKHAPEMAEKIKSAQAPDSDYLKAFEQGGKQYKIDKRVEESREAKTQQQQRAQKRRN